jgi:PadR family transcriptional regulator PadR
MFPGQKNVLIHLRVIHFFIIIEEMHRRSYFGEFELMVMLALMRLGEHAYGVPICREIEEHGGREVAVGSVYATLERLEEKGLVSSRIGEPTAERGGRAKRYFQVTARGRREVRDTQRALMNLWNGLPELERGMA